MLLNVFVAINIITFYLFINSWFLLDENLVPPSYVLQPISSHFPNFLSNDMNARSKAKNAWWDVFCKLQNVLVRGAKENLKDPKKLHNYVMSGRYIH